jgi:hypothetical protein
MPPCCAAASPSIRPAGNGHSCRGDDLADLCVCVRVGSLGSVVASCHSAGTGRPARRRGPEFAVSTHGLAGQPPGVADQSIATFSRDVVVHRSGRYGSRAVGVICAYFVSIRSDEIEIKTDWWPGVIDMFDAFTTTPRIRMRQSP